MRVFGVQKHKAPGEKQQEVKSEVQASEEWSAHGQPLNTGWRVSPLS